MQLIALLFLFWPKVAVVASDMFVVNAVDPMSIAAIPIDQPPSVGFATHFEIHDYFLISL